MLTGAKHGRSHETEAPSSRAAKRRRIVRVSRAQAATIVSRPAPVAVSPRQDHDSMARPAKIRRIRIPRDAVASPAPPTASTYHGGASSSTLLSSSATAVEAVTAMARLQLRAAPTPAAAALIHSTAAPPARAHSAVARTSVDASVAPYLSTVAAACATVEPAVLAPLAPLPQRPRRRRRRRAPSDADTVMEGRQS